MILFSLDHTYPPQNVCVFQFKNWNITNIYIWNESTIIWHTNIDQNTITEKWVSMNEQPASDNRHWSKIEIMTEMQ